MKQIMNEEQLDEQFNRYVKENKQEIDNKIQKKIGTTINQAINEAFDHYTGGWARQTVESMVQKELTDYISNGNAVQIDMDEVRDRITKQVRLSLKKIKVSVGE